MNMFLNMTRKRRGNPDNEVNYQQIHVTLDGTSDGTGTILDPVDLYAVLNGSTPNVTPQAGDTIHIHEGRYVGEFIAWIGGTETEKINIKAYNDDLVIFDSHTPGIESEWGASIYTANDNLRFENLMFTSSYTERVTVQTGPFPEDIDHKGGMIIGSYNVDVINCTFYDIVGGAIGAYRDGGEFYGNIMFNNGWDAPDRGHGHSLYLQNGDINNPKIVENNMCYNGFMYGVKIYGTNVGLRGFNVKDNIAFNPAILSVPGDSKDSGRGIFIGGRHPAVGIDVQDNCTYKSEWGITVTGASLQIGWSEENEDVVCKNNWAVGGTRTLTIEKWRNADIQGNTVVARPKTATEPQLRDSVIRYYTHEAGNDGVFIDNNRYFCGDNPNPVEEDGWWISYESWQNDVGMDANSPFTIGLPTENHVAVIPNRYIDGRAHIAIYNWEGLSEVPISVDNVLNVGDTYYLYDSENLFGDPVETGVYSGGTINVPMELTEVRQPQGNYPVALIHTTSEFGAYLLTSTPLIHEFN